MNKRIFTNTTKNAVLPESAEAGKPIVIQLAPAGEYPQFVGGETGSVPTSFPESMRPGREGRRNRVCPHKA